MAKLNDQERLLFTPQARKSQINAGVAALNKLRKKQRDVIGQPSPVEKDEKALR